MDLKQLKIWYACLTREEREELRAHHSGWEWLFGVNDFDRLKTLYQTWLIKNTIWA